MHIAWMQEAETEEELADCMAVPDCEAALYCKYLGSFRDDKDCIVAVKKAEIAAQLMANVGELMPYKEVPAGASACFVIRSHTVNVRYVIKQALKNILVENSVTAHDFSL